jgi:hypothetical protein
MKVKTNKKKAANPLFDKSAPSRARAKSVDALRRNLLNAGDVLAAEKDTAMT